MLCGTRDWTQAKKLDNDLYYCYRIRQPLRRLQVLERLEAHCNTM